MEKTLFQVRKPPLLNTLLQSNIPLPPSRHLNLAQTVTLTVITAGDALERAKLLHRYINVAQLLQSQKYGNLFSFIAIMQGLAAPQVGESVRVAFLSLNRRPGGGGGVLSVVLLHIPAGI